MLFYNVEQAHPHAIVLHHLLQHVRTSCYNDLLLVCANIHCMQEKDSLLTGRKEPQIARSCARFDCQYS